VIIVLDNYDSFVYNLVQYLGELGEAEVTVLRNDAVSAADLLAMRPEGLVISPGPCTPAAAGVTLETVRLCAGAFPILGVCLGHQAIGQAFGGQIRRAVRPMHGKTSRITHDGAGVFAGLPEPLEVCRYHSLVVDAATLPDCLVATAWAPDGELMGLRHRTLPVEGVQFHPESLFTAGGHRLLENWLAQRVRRRRCSDRDLSHK
jgi:anthranilate synthase/aminodeoxychorismate synthase-like glutamine amidotransferase